jgi:hypothetical protein
MQRILAFGILWLWLANVACAQPVQLSGKVVDTDTQEPLPYASISVEGTSIGVVANTEGEFVLNVPQEHTDASVAVSYLGYAPERHRVTEIAGRPWLFSLKTDGISIAEVAIEATRDEKPLIERVVAKIDANYPQIPVMLTGFYRNRLTADATRSEYLYIEAVLKMYKAAYDYSFDEDQVSLLKGRRKPTPGTITSRDGAQRAELPALVSGPQAGTVLDIAARRPPFLNTKTLRHYAYSIVGETEHEGRPVYILDYTARDTASKEAHSSGRLYIDQATEALVRAEYRTSNQRVAQENKSGSELMVLDQRQTVQYKRYGDTWYLQFVEAETGYRSRTTGQRLTLKLEFLVTAIDIENVAPFGKKEVLAASDVIEERTTTDDSAFWDAYNVIK